MITCHICSQSTVKFVDEKTQITYYHCSACEYIFKSPLCYQDFDAQKERYNLHENNDEDIHYQAYFQHFLDFTLPLVGRPRHALDFGCGCTSLLATLLEEQGISCDYYDPIYHPDTLKSDAKYDLIVSTEVFEHLHQPKEVFSDVVARLNEGGYLAIQTQFHTNDLTQFKTWYYHRDTTHIVFFTPKTFEVLCYQHGCCIIRHNAKNMIVIQKGKIDA